MSVTLGSMTMTESPDTGELYDFLIPGTARHAHPQWVSRHMHDAKEAETFCVSRGWLAVAHHAEAPHNTVFFVNTTS